MSDDRKYFYQSDIKCRKVEYNEYLTIDLWKKYLADNKDLFYYFPLVSRQSECESHLRIGDPRDCNEEFYTAIISTAHEEEFKKIVAHYKNLRITEKTAKTNKINVNKKLHEKFKEFHSKYKVKFYQIFNLFFQTKRKSIAMIVNKDTTKEKKKANSEEEKTKTINEMKESKFISI